MQEVLSLSQLPPGHMHGLTVGDYEVLLANVDGQVYAVENRCTHYNFALTKGALCEHRVRCPLHHACFDVRTGRQLEAPGLDDLRRFRVEVRDGAVFVADTPDAEERPDLSAEVQPQRTAYDYVIVGGGVAAAYAAEAIRELDRTGSLLVIGREMLPPYDRTKVSKGLLSGDAEAAALPLRSTDFYRRLGVHFRAGTQVQRLDVNAKSVTLDGGETIGYGRVLLATGAEPRRLPVPGAELTGVHTVRRIADAEAARAAAGAEARVVIVGSSFIGLECAMSLGQQGAAVTVVGTEEVPFAGVFGERVGAYVRDLHTAAGVEFRLGRRVTEITGTETVDGVVLDDGERLAADLVIVGIGVVPATDYLAGLAAQDDGSIAVDAHLAAHADGVWVAGDIATYPDREGMLRIEHWKVAAQQGRVAGHNMAGQSVPYSMLPFFWTNQQGINFRYLGHATDYDEIVFDGTPGETPFLAFYVKDAHVQAVLGVKRDAEAAAISELMSSGRMPAVADLAGQDWLARCRRK